MTAPSDISPPPFFIFSVKEVAQKMEFKNKIKKKRTLRNVRWGDFISQHAIENTKNKRNNSLRKAEEVSK